MMTRFILSALAGLAVATSTAARAEPPAVKDAPPDKPAKSEPRGQPVDEAKQRADVLKSLYAELAKAPDPVTAEKIVQAVEQVWQQSGSPTADLLVRRAINAVQTGKGGLALRLLDAVAELNPDYAETFSRRAFIYFSQQDFARALADLRRVLAIDPNHFRAMEGLVQTLRAMGNNKAALEVLNELIKAHPNSPGANEALEQLKRDVEGQGI